MTRNRHLARRDFLAAAAAATALGGSAFSSDSQRPAPKKVAAIITAYEYGYHADVLVGKILEGWKQDRGPGPLLKLESMYVEQFTNRDLSRKISQQYGVPLFDSIEKAVTVGGAGVPVDGVLCIGEHGQYPFNEKGQQLYPRRRFFEEITNTFAKYGRVVPVFNDKHLGPMWSDAKWMYDRAQEQSVPFMAGSSVTVGYRKPDVTIPMGCDVEAAVGIGYSGLDIYGSHALEFFQCNLERRRNAESGVKWVQCLEGKDAWKVLDDGLVSQELFDAALAVTPHRNGDVRKDGDPVLFLFQYVDGLMGSVFMLPSFSEGMSVAVKEKGRSEILATSFEERTVPRHPHFAWLLKAVERMFHTGRPSYPVERTLLTSGILDRALTSRQQGHQKLETPELEIRYQAVDYPHAPYPDLNSDPTAQIKI